MSKDAPFHVVLSISKQGIDDWNHSPATLSLEPTLYDPCLPESPFPWVTDLKNGTPDLKPKDNTAQLSLPFLLVRCKETLELFSTPLFLTPSTNPSDNSLESVYSEYIWPLLTLPLLWLLWASHHQLAPVSINSFLTVLSAPTSPYILSTLPGVKLFKR